MSKSLVCLIMVCTAVSLPASASAAPISFDNPPGPGHFTWVPLGNNINVFLDIRLPASSQPGSVGGASVIFQRLLTGTRGTLQGVPALYTNPAGGSLLVGVNIGDPIPIPGGVLTSGSSTIYAPSLGGSLLPEGVPTYLGVRFDAGLGFQYGWIEVIRSVQTLDALSWGYETEVGVPISAGAPEPGSLVLLAFGAMAVVAKRRRLA